MCDLGNGTRLWALDESGRKESSLGERVLLEDFAHLSGALVGNFETDVYLICHEGLTESFLLTLREPITRGAQEKPIW